jgi:hypothetical protein
VSASEDVPRTLLLFGDAGTTTLLLELDLGDCGGVAGGVGSEDIARE